MATECKYCGSTRTKSRGVRQYKEYTVQSRFCNDCSSFFQVNDYIKEEKEDEIIEIKTGNPKLNEVNRKFGGVVSSKKKYVISSAQNDTDTNLEFLGALINYCNINDAELIIIPVRYVNPTIYTKPVGLTWDSNLVKYFCDEKLNLGKHVKIVGDLKINATMQSPLTGLDALTQGMSTIVGHSQLQFKSIPRLKGCDPVILTTTGSVSCENYSSTRVGYIAEFNHSFSAVVVELDGDIFYLRHLVGDDNNGFYDLDAYYTNNSYKKKIKATAIVFGDEHVGFSCPDTQKATFGKDGLCEKLQPEYLIRHDLFDARSISHHDEQSFLKKVSKSLDGHDDLLRELELTAAYLEDTTPDGCTSVIVSSNHDRHLNRWLDSPKSPYDVKNAYIYTVLRQMVLWSISARNDSTDPFILWMKSRLKRTSNSEKFKFLEQDESYMLNNVELGAHGDLGANGARGSVQTYSKLGVKTITGHAHHPAIEKGAYRTGTSTVLDLGYNSGLTSWINTHCVLYPNGKRQLINIIKGKFTI